MSILSAAAPISLGILAAAIFYTAFKYRESNILGRFELLFGIGNLFVLALLFTIYLSLQQDGDSFANVVFPLFQAMMWIYVLICLVLIFRLIRNIIGAMWNKKLKEYIGW